MNETERQNRESDDIAALLRLAGPREKLPEAMKAGWEATFRRELAAARHARQARRKAWTAGVAATVALCAVALTLLLNAPTQAPDTRIRVTALWGNTTLLQSDGETVQLVEGMRIPPGSALATSSDSRVGLNYGGYTLRLDVDSHLVLHSTEIQLAAGRLYAGDSAQRIGQTQLTIITPHGAVRDIGTQFTVQVGDDSTIATVRQGVIQVAVGTSEFQLEATPVSAARLRVNSSGETLALDVPATGDDWRWIYTVRPPFELEGKSILEFLQWSANESGRKLAFASAAAELYARRVLLHGSATGLDPEQAIAPVLEATDLTARQRGDTLLLSLRD